MEKAKIEKQKGITGSTLKLIAIGTMLIDHAAVVLLESLMMSGKIGDINALYTANSPSSTIVFVYYIYMSLRLVGRLGYPLFCFLLIEGFQYTRSKGKYVLRLSLFALISEVPFDLAFNKQVLEFTYQNVFFTLAVGLLTIWGIDTILQKIKIMSDTGNGKKFARGLSILFITLIGMYIAYLLRTDYAAMGVLTIVVMYFFSKKSRKAEIIGGCTVLTVMTLVECTAFATVPIVMNYNGKRGINMKYLFYFFYPVHLLILCGIAVLLGIY